MSEVVKVEGLFKRYGKHAPWAVEDVSFSVGEGEIVGLLGHNGAGKSCPFAVATSSANPSRQRRIWASSPMTTPSLSR